jgi:cbb3-type cytochrome oxidase cytochrome c subunit
LVTGVGVLVVAGIALLTVLAMRDPPAHYSTPPHPLGANPEVRRGYDVTRREGCFGCHMVEGRYGATQHGAPDLTRIERPAANLVLALADPLKRLETKDMPNYAHLAASDRLAIGRYLEAIRSSERDYPLPPPAPEHAAGRSLAIEQGCFSCHQYSPGSGGPIYGRRRHDAPGLRDMGQQADGAAMILEDPEGAISSMVMPAYDHLSEAQRLAIGRYLEFLGDQ